MPTVCLRPLKRMTDPDIPGMPIPPSEHNGGCLRVACSSSSRAASCLLFRGVAQVGPSTQCAAHKSDQMFGSTPLDTVASLSQADLRHRKQRHAADEPAAGNQVALCRLVGTFSPSHSRSALVTTVVGTVITVQLITHYHNVSDMLL
jgi:hypothetical protein